MAIRDIRLDPNISKGFQSIEGFRTGIQVTQSGHEGRNQRASQPRRRYVAKKDLLTPAQFASVKAIWMAARGSLIGFRFKDWTDYTSNPTDNIGTRTETDQLLGYGNGTGHNFQLFKTYDPTGPRPLIRICTLPVAGTVKVALDGVNQTSGWSVSNPGGQVTFTSAPGNGVAVSAGFEFDVPVRFETSVDQAFTGSLTTPNRIDAESLACIEILDETMVPESWDPGGFYQPTFSEDLSLTLYSGKVVALDPTTTGLIVFLPFPQYLPPGFAYELFNLNGSRSFTLADHAGATVCTMAASQARRIVLKVDLSGNYTWKASA